MTAPPVIEVYALSLRLRTSSVPSIRLRRMKPGPTTRDLVPYT